MPNRVAINGLGRIGRAALKLALAQPELELVAVNEIGSLDNMVYLLKYDTVYRRYERQVEAVDDKLVIDGRPLVYLSERDPERLPWGQLGRAVRPDQGPGRADDRPRGQPPRRPDPDHLLRQLHHQQHHPAGGDPRPALRRREGLADDGARLHRDPGPGRQ